MPHGFPELKDDEEPSADGNVMYSDGRDDPPALRFLHYNDIYHPDPQSAEPTGGAARFQTLVNYYRHDAKFQDETALITVFSGDAYNPSKESAVTRGSHMVGLLNNIGTDIACPGNHDFDFGAAQFENLQSRCKFPWILTNVFDPAKAENGEKVPLGSCHRTHIMEASNGIKIGFMGLADREWAEKGNTLPKNLEYHEMLDVAKKVGPELRKQGADIVVAMTHCREPRDLAFGEALPDGCIDMIFAGHDHWWDHRVWKNGTHLVRSGSDFKMLSYIRAWRSKAKRGRWDWEITRRHITASIPEDGETKKTAEKTLNQIRQRIEKSIGYTIVALDARASTVTSKESNWANFACDLLRLYYRSDVAIMTSGTVQGDQVHAPGIIRLKFITESFPFEDSVVVLRVTGSAIWEALENGVRSYPDKENIAFLHVSGMKYSFDPNAQPGRRVQSVQVGNAPIDLQRKYSLACRSRLAFGQAGFDSLLMKSHGGPAEELIPDEYGMLVSMIVRQYFMSLQVLSGLSVGSSGSGMESAWDEIGSQLQQIHPVRDGDVDPATHDPAYKGNVDTYSSDDEDAPTPGTQESVEHGRRLAIMRKTIRKWRKAAGLKGDPQLPTYEEEKSNADWTTAICPQLEGRIQIVGKG